MVFQECSLCLVWMFSYLFLCVILHPYRRQHTTILYNDSWQMQAMEKMPALPKPMPVNACSLVGREHSAQLLRGLLTSLSAIIHPVMEENSCPAIMTWKRAIKTHWVKIPTWLLVLGFSFMTVDEWIAE